MGVTATWVRILLVPPTNMQIQMEKVTIVSPLTKSEEREFYDLQTILCNLLPDMHIVDILWLSRDSTPKEARRLLKRLKHLMRKQNKVTRENI